MKMIIWKELRENLKWAMLGNLIFGIALVYAWLKLNEPWSDYSRFSYQSVCSPIVLLVTTIGCAVLGGAFGLLQTLTELRSRDQWAFLVHRPILRQSIFFGKVVAGIILYLLATILPFTLLSWWASLPGKVAAPFDWRMSLAGYADILAGLCYYFGLSVVSCG